MCTESIVRIVHTENGELLYSRPIEKLNILTINETKQN